MALKIAVTQSDGVVTDYHRILFIQNTVNQQTSIAVLSYVNENARAQEKEAVIAQPYSRSVTYETEYTENMTIAAAYDYLKTLPNFEGAVDV